MLDNNREVLVKSGWPTNPRGFITRLMDEDAPGNAELFDLIADAYGDDYNRGRSDLPLVKRLNYKLEKYNF
ncbi:hypothetical protein A3A76_06010 [Candidatus Woesebacteria bacterium RIFCSPLOWO2_01_FULL_39_23]|nr:MAG: hypothetical protein A3A76_06010 [Candidatus Woesebacteria bacterium RIFCSPLOWO2_01_FULL_39_23]